MGEQLDIRVEALARTAAELGEQLTEAGEALKTRGVLPAVDLTGRLERLHQEYRDLQAELAAGWQAAGRNEPLADTISVLQEQTRELEDIRRKSNGELRWLLRAAAVASDAEADVALIAEIRERSSAIYQAAAASSVLEGELARRAKPYIALARLLGERESLTDDELIDYDDLVKSELPGRAAIALLRNRLYLLPETDEAVQTAPLTGAAADEPAAADEARDAPAAVPAEAGEPEHASAAAAEQPAIPAEPAPKVTAPGIPVRPPVMPNPHDLPLTRRFTPLTEPPAAASLAKGKQKDAGSTAKTKAKTKTAAKQPDPGADRDAAAAETAAAAAAPEAAEPAAAPAVAPVTAAEEPAATAALEAAAPPAPAPAPESAAQSAAVAAAEPATPAPEPAAAETPQAAASEPAAAAPTAATPTAEQPAAPAPQSKQPRTPEQLRAMTTRELAGVLAEGADDEATSRNALMSLFWRLTAEDRLGHAYRIAERIQHAYGESGEAEAAPARLIRAVLLARHVRHNTGGIMHVLKDDYEQLLAAHDDGAAFGEPMRNLLAAAAIRPSLLAPNTNGVQVLSELQFTGSLYEFMQKILGFCESYMPLDIGVLRNIRDESGWQTEMKQLQARTQSTMHSLQGSRILYQPASKVWRRWFEPNGFIPTMMRPVLQNDETQLEWLREQVKRYSDPAEVKAQVDYTDRYEVERASARNEIIGRALGQLQSHMADLIDLAREWIDLVEAKPGNTKAFHLRSAQELQQALGKLYEPVMQELAIEASDSLPVRAGKTMFRQAVQHVYDLFDPAKQFPNKEPDPAMTLNRELIMVPAIGIRENGEPVDDSFPVEALIEALAAEPLTAHEVFAERLEREDLEGAGLLLKRAEQEGADTAEWQAAYDKRIAECRESLIINIRDAAKRVELNFTANLLSESERAGLLAVLDAMERGIAEIHYFPENKSQLDDMRAALEQARQRAADRTWAQFHEAGLHEAHPDYARIRAVLDSGDLHTANEYLNRFQQGVSLEPPEAEREPFREFFQDGKFFAELEHYLETARTRAVQEIKRGRSAGPLNLTIVPGAQLNQAADMMDAWFKAKHQPGSQVLEERYLRTIMNGIGLSVLTVQKQPPARSGRGYQLIQTEALSDQNRCPIPHFGSEAGGSYRVYSFWDRLTEEDLLHEIGETGHGQPPVLVFYFGRLTDRKRRDLARLSKERRRTFLLLDETLLLYLCGERGSRLPIFFKCAMPFTYLEPYTTTASLIPTEMFYGRKDELKAIMDGKSSLVYGGRQLGKTALLREAERSFHNPAAGRYAVWIDLKAEGIGYNKPADEIWNVIARELNRIGVADMKTGAVSPDKLFDQIKNWLDAQSNRRILLLLDESDRFLEIDANEFGAYADESGKNRAGFIRCSKIKGVIERTNKRFHVVFAGLHNVQRSVKNQNDPLAHLGRAICVGPLLSKDEWREARNLIVRPFEAMGYFFQSLDLVTRILSQTNYYPSLIQLYCHQLLRHMTEHRALASFATKTPPYFITSRHLDEAYQDRELQQAIRHRFQLTLQLDPRYELIAYIIAHESLTSDQLAREGMPVKDIREQSIAYWSEGMQGIAADSFRILLDEMVDLGVLRRVTEGFYALRSPNLLSLMGSVNEIEDELLREDRELRNEYNASHFRPAYMNGGVDLSVRSPLTAEQESELNHPGSRVAVMIGNRSAGIADVEKFLKMSAKVVTIQGVGNKTELLRAIQEQAAAKKTDEETIVLIDTDCAWSPEWLGDIRQLLEGAKLSHVKVVLLADAEQTYTLAKTCDDAAGELMQEGVLVLQLKQWHEITLGQWLSDCELEKTRQIQREIMSATGNWPSILKRLYELVKPNPHQLKAQLAAFRERLLQPDARADILAEMGVARKEAKDVLGVLAVLEEASMDDLLALCMEEFGMPETQVRPVLQWAELLGLVRYVGKNMRRVDPVLADLLQAERNGDA